MINIYTESDLPIHSETDLHVHQYKQTRVPYIWIFHHIFPYNCRRFLSQVAFPHPWLEHDAPPVLGSPSDSFD